jgi:hypothetical protein
VPRLHPPEDIFEKKNIRGRWEVFEKLFENGNYLVILFVLNSVFVDKVQPMSRGAWRCFSPGKARLCQGFDLAVRWCVGGMRAGHNCRAWAAIQN